MANGGRLAGISGTARLIARLFREKLTRQQIADELGTEIAAADRQRRAIASQFPLRKERQQDGRVLYWIDRGALPGEPKAGLATVMAACIAASLSRLFARTRYETGMHDALDLVLQRGSRPEVRHAVERRYVFLVRGGESALPERAAVLDSIVDALEHRKLMKLRYKSHLGNRQSATVQPLSLAIYDHQLYLLAKPEGGAAGPYRFSRIEEVTPQGKHFKYPTASEYDPEQVFADSFGVFVGAEFPLEELELELASNWKTFVTSHRWHQSQRVKFLRGKIRVSMRVRICPEVRAWILGFGEGALVLKPDFLRRELQQRFARAAHRYARRARRRSR
jgi:predicted DNA-binding transcriptional regulator YafY